MKIINIFIIFFSILSFHCNGNEKKLEKNPSDEKQDVLEVDNHSYDPQTGEFVLDKYTVGLWHFNEGRSEFAFDATGNGNDGVISNGKWVDGLFSKCISLTQGSDGIEIIEENYKLSPKHAVTVEAWFNFSEHQSGSFPNILGKPTREEGDMSSSYTFWIVNHRHESYPLFSINFGVTPENNNLQSIDSRTYWKKLIGNWHHIAGTYNGKKIKIFIDGELKAEKEVSGKLASRNDILYIGNIMGQNYNGLIDELRISKVARSAKAIKEYWEFSEKFRLKSK